MAEDMPDRMPEDMQDRMPEDLPEDMPDRMPDRMPEDMSDKMPEDMPEDLPDRMPEDMPEHMPDRMPDRMPEDMSDRMPQDLPVRKCINVMVGITRSKVFFFCESANFVLVKSYSFLRIQLGRDSNAPFLVVRNQWSPPVRAAGESVGLAASRAPAGATDLGILNRDNLTPAIKHLNGKCLFIDDFPIETSFYRGLFHCHV